MNPTPRKRTRFKLDAGGADFVPAHSIEAEQSVLGSMCISNEAADNGLDLLDYTDFYREPHQAIFVCFRDLRLLGQPVDLVTVPAALKDRGQMDFVGGMPYLLSLFDAVPTASNIAFYADILLEKASLRRLAMAGLEILDLASQADRKADDLTREAESAIYGLKRGGAAESGALMSDTLSEFEQELDEAEGVPLSSSGQMSGLSLFDGMCGGVTGNQLIIIAARTGMGKTATLCTMAVGLSALSGEACYIHSAEMSKRQLSVRTISMMAEVDTKKLRKNGLSPAEWDRYSTARNMLANSPIFVDDSKRPSPGYIRRTAQRVRSQYGGLSSIWVDYIGLMAADRPTDNEVNDLGRIAQDLKDLSGELNVPIFLLCQLNRAAESRDNKRPVLADLRQSGKIEEAADIVIGLYREPYYQVQDDAADPDEVEELEMIFLKHRDGRRGMVKVGFKPAFTRVMDLPDELGAMANGPTGF